MRKLFRELESCRHMRGGYRVKPKLQARFDRANYMMYVLPTITIQPWLYRKPGTFVVAFRWLHFRLAYGLWEKCEEW